MEKSEVNERIATDAPSAHADPADRSGTRTLIAGLLLFVGFQLSLLLLHAQWPPKVEQDLFLAALAVAVCIPAVARRIVSIFDAIRYPTRRTQRFLAIGISLASCIALYLEAKHQARTFTPRFQDEFSYLIGARMLAHGHVWMPAHPLAEFFANFQLLASPVYASCYFPGAAMLFAPGIWLGLPFWMMPLLISGAGAGLVYLIFTDLIDGVAGIVGATMLLSVSAFRLMSIMAMAQAPALMLALALILSWLRWRESKKPMRALAIGICAGWLAITRPVDALCILIPISIALVFDLRVMPLRAMINALVLMVLAALPFLTVQIAFNLRVTGSPLRTPFELMSSLTYPQTAYGFHGFDPAVRPPLDLPQVQKYYDMDVISLLKQHATIASALREWRAYRLKATLIEITPGALPLILAPVGLLALVDRKRWIVFALLPMFVMMYFFYAFFLAHYVVIAIPAMLLAIALGIDVISTLARNRERFKQVGLGVAAFIPIAVVGLSITESSAFNRSAYDDPFRFEELSNIDVKLQNIPDPRAIVLFNFTESNSPHIEPVYNIDVSWPDDARVVRAHDRGDAANGKLLRYYADHQPDRAVYRYDRAAETLTRLGNVRDLAARVQSSAASKPPGD